MPLVFLTAWHMLVGRARASEADETCLVIAAGSGVGSAAIQVAKVLGARVIATAGSAAKLEQAKRLGADAVIDHSKQDLTTEVRALTDKRGVDVVCEHVGGEVFEHAVAALARNGRLVTCGGATAGHRVTLDLNQLFGRHLSLMGSWMGRRSEMLEVLEHVARRATASGCRFGAPARRRARGATSASRRGNSSGKIVLVP